MLLDDVLNKYVASGKNRRLKNAPSYKPPEYRDVYEKPGNMREYLGMLREGYDPPISRSLEVNTREFTSEPYESGALTS
jgi:hypothetical protein